MKEESYYAPYKKDKVGGKRVTIYEFPYEEGSAFILGSPDIYVHHVYKNGEKKKIKYRFGSKVRKRKRVLMRNPQCAHCGLKGTKWVLSYYPDDNMQIQMTLYSNNNVEMTIDHIMEVCQGGNWCQENLQTLCYACNQRKSLKNNMKPRHWEYGFQQDPNIELPSLIPQYA
jgi:hypothetical protein